MESYLFMAIHFCVECLTELPRSTVMDNHGVCPQCGNSSGDTIINTYTKICKATRLSPWWNFWKPKFKREYLEKDTININEGE